MIVEYVLNVALVITIISLITMIILMVFNAAIPTILFWVLGISLLFAGVSLLYMRKKSVSSID